VRSGTSSFAKIYLCTEWIALTIESVCDGIAIGRMAA